MSSSSSSLLFHSDFASKCLVFFAPEILLILVAPEVVSFAVFVSLFESLVVFVALWSELVDELPVAPGVLVVEFVVELLVVSLSEQSLLPHLIILNFHHLDLMTVSRSSLTFHLAAAFVAHLVVSCRTFQGFLLLWQPRFSFIFVNKKNHLSRSCGNCVSH